MHISMVTLGVRDLAAATRFYEELGWRRSEESVEGVVAFMMGGAAVLGLYGWDALAEDATVPTGDGDGFRGVALAVNLPTREAVDDLVAAAAAAGAEIPKQPQAVPWGGYSGYVRDLDGHLWEVAHNPGFPIDDEGRIHLQR